MVLRGPPGAPKASFSKIGYILVNFELAVSWLVDDLLYRFSLLVCISPKQIVGSILAHSCFISLLMKTLICKWTLTGGRSRQHNQPLLLKGSADRAETLKSAAPCLQGHEALRIVFADFADSSWPHKPLLDPARPADPGGVERDLTRFCFELSIFCRPFCWSKIHQKSDLSKTSRKLQIKPLSAQRSIRSYFGSSVAYHFRCFFAIHRNLVFCNMYTAKCFFASQNIPSWHQKSIPKSCFFKTVPGSHFCWFPGPSRSLC